MDARTMESIVRELEDARAERARAELLPTNSEVTDAESGRRLRAAQERAMNRLARRQTNA